MPRPKRPVPIPFSGTALLEMSLLNKGSAFSQEEREQFKLHGLIPEAVESIEEQATRAYAQYGQVKIDIEKHIFLRHLQDTNETLFYHLVSKHLREMLPILYTPVVGEACERFSDIYRANRGVFISFPNRHLIRQMLDNVTKKNVKVITVTDGERILGLGDQGIGGMGIPIGKLSLYTACGGISPAYTLPMVLDVGTNNQRLIDDPLYMGWRHPRISGPDYEAFVEEFIVAVKKKWPKVLLQFEDFALKNAVPLLQRYRRRICCFNDDIQGTAVVALGTLLSACRMKDERLRDQRVVFLGAGSAGCGIAEKIVMRMKQDGLTDEEARARVFMVDRFGLLTDKMPNLLGFQMALAQKAENVAAWATGSEEISLLETVKSARPTILIGVSGQPGLFTEQVIRTMHAACPRPVVLPLSNPNTRVEALPEDVLRWTDGQAMVATGSPFPPVHLGGREFAIAQCNNSYIFPGIGLGVISVGATEVTDGMLMAASDALAEITNELQGPAGGLLPEIEQIEKVSRRIAMKVGAAAQRDGVAELKGEADLAEAIEQNFWRPEYRAYKPAEPR